jgi:hypothetical protein
MQLIINTFGASLQRRGELFRVAVGDRNVEIAARKVQSILLTTGSHFSSDSKKDFDESLVQGTKKTLLI